ncbi:MAG: MFS transporter, partial [Myxococcota bacterium]
MDLKRKLGVIALVYVIEGYPMGVFQNVLQMFFARAGLSKAEIGYLSGLSLAWTLKVLWSPLVDRFGLRRQWIACANIAMALALLALGQIGASEATLALWLAASAYTAASATQDIAIDAYTIGMVAVGQEGPANAMRNTGYRGGMLLAGALLFLPDVFGWQAALGAGAALHALAAAAVYGTPRVEVPLAARQEMWPAVRRWLARDGAALVFLFVLLFRIGDLAMGPMIAPFWKDQGLSNREFSVVSVTLGVAAMLAGSWLAGGLVVRFGIGRCLWAIGAVALASNLGYAAAAAAPGAGPHAIYAASLVASLCSGLAGVTFLSYLLRLCAKDHT